MTPKCCNQDAKWVEQTVNLKYWYCSRCCNEVKEGADIGILDKASSEFNALSDWISVSYNDFWGSL